MSNENPSKSELLKRIEELSTPKPEHIREYPIQYPVNYIKRDPYNARYFPKNKEQNTQPSKTVPDQTMSLRTILTRYAHGLPIDQKVPMYDGEESIGINYQTLDLSEREALRDANKAEIEALKQKLNTTIQPTQQTPPEQL